MTANGFNCAEIGFINLDWNLKNYDKYDDDLNCDRIRGKVTD